MFEKIIQLLAGNQQDEKNKKEYKEENVSLFGIISNLMVDDKNNKKNKPYSSYQFDEEELEEDDFHYDDLD